MDNTATVDIPNLKLKKVDEKRKRKGAGVAWFGGGGGAGGSFVGAMGGSGFSVAKVLVALLATGSIGAASWMVGGMISRGGDATKPGPKLFAEGGTTAKYEDTSGVIKADNAIPNSMGYVSGSLDGMSAEERAKKQADDEAARKAAEDEQKKADEAAGKAPTPEATSAADPATIATTQGDKPALKAGKFGSMNTFGGGGAGGGGLSGGAGLSGGINRNFGATGVNGKVIGAQKGTLASFRTPVKPGLTAAQGMNKGKTKGFAKSQLLNAFTQSKQANAAGATENAAAAAANPFDNNAAQGAVITGPGVGAGVTAGAAGTSGPTNPGSTGGSTPCGNGQSVGSDGSCQNTSTPGSSNATKYQNLIDMSVMLMGIASIVGMVAIAFAPAQPICMVILAMLGSIIAGFGTQIIQQSGDTKMGGIVTLVGGFIAGAGALGAIVGGATVIPIAAAGSAIAGALGALASAGHPPAASQ